MILVVICLVLGGCKQTQELSKTLGALVAVRSQIIRRFGEDNVNINLNGGAQGSILSVTFINSGLNDQDRAKRLERAQQTAELVKEHYSDIKSVDGIVVAFSRVTTILAVFHSTKIVDVLWFDRDARPTDKTTDTRLAVESTNRVEEDPLEPQVNYSSVRNETELYLGGVLLEGVPEKGLTMIPRISVRGNTNKTTPDAPESMRFDFASFADKRQFPGVTKIKFITDKSYEFDGQFSLSNSNDGLTSEFLYLQVPYSDYQQIANSDEVTVVIGKKKFVLSHHQIQALNRLTKFIKAQP